MERLRPPGTELQHAAIGTIRLKLLKLGALVTIRVRRIKIAIASAVRCAIKKKLPDWLCHTDFS